MNRELRFQGAILWGTIVLAVASLIVATPKAAAAEPVTFTVTAVGNHAAPPHAISKSDVQLYQNKERLQVADWKHGETLYLAVLIDDSLDSVVANQWGDLKAFLMSQPETTYEAVAYARNGTAMVAQDFTKDHALAAKALRIPLGDAGAFSSPYLAVQDWIKRWPDSNERKSIVMFTSGIDYFRGSFELLDPDLDTTIEHAQKKNINVWTIYAEGAGHLSRRAFRIFYAQSNLSRLSEETGAESYYLGLGEPVTFKPYFDEIKTHLENQYLLTFESSAGGQKGRFQSVHVGTELPQTQFMVPSAVFLPPVK
jgi:hypothetical protein